MGSEGNSLPLPEQIDVAPRQRLFKRAPIPGGGEGEPAAPPPPPPPSKGPDNNGASTSGTKGSNSQQPPKEGFLGEEKKARFTAAEKGKGVANEAKPAPTAKTNAKAADTAIIKSAPLDAKTGAIKPYSPTVITTNAKGEYVPPSRPLNSKTGAIQPYRPTVISKAPAKAPAKKMMGKTMMALAGIAALGTLGAATWATVTHLKGKKKSKKHDE
ncbi:hypothetical protein CBS101457_006906 [Exobasidium rhododendri]|nr:hypothetical protein CBS101457_006906 [Exobasidium rhododendri]